MRQIDTVSVRTLARCKLREYQPDTGDTVELGKWVSTGSVAAASEVEHAPFPHVIVGAVKGHSEYGGGSRLGQNEVACVLVLAHKGDVLS
jgi:hypothetical protein